MILCDLCNKNEGNIWCRSWGGYRGTPLFHQYTANICSDCNENRKSEINELTTSRLEENRLAVIDGIKKTIWSDETNLSGMKEFAFQYWFKNHEWNDLKQYEEYLGFELPDKFKETINNLKCCECEKHIRKLTDEEGESIVKTLPPLTERPDAFTKEEKENSVWFKDGEQTTEGTKEWKRRYDEYLKDELNAYDNIIRLWTEKFTILFKAIKYVKNRPDSSLNEEEYSKAFIEYEKSKITYYFCSKECAEKAMEKDENLIWVYF